MEDSRTRTVTAHLKDYDRLLYARRESTGAIHVYRESKRPYSFEYNGDRYTALLSQPFFILALTDNWTITGKPVEWGIEPLMYRIKSIDSHKNGITIDKLLEDYTRGAEAKDKKRQNDNESWLRDNRNVFKKAFDGINTSNLDGKRKGI